MVNRETAIDADTLDSIARDSYHCLGAPCNHMYVNMYFCAYLAMGSDTFQLIMYVFAGALCSSLELEEMKVVYVSVIRCVPSFSIPAKF